jgi:hypothetical protein
MVRILSGAAAGVRTSFVMPTMPELKKLRDTVLKFHPRFTDPDQDSHAMVQTLINCFRGIGALGRLDGIETRNVKSIGWWTAHVSDNCRADGLEYVDFGAGLFALCVLMHADIPHSVTHRFPHDVSYGLSPGSSNRPATDGWRRLLRGGAPLAPSALPPEMTEPPMVQSTVRFYG